MLLVKPYDRDRAVEYARRWALSRNPLFVDFTGQGGNCTNFVSQSILAGSCVMNYTPTFGWYYVSSTDRSPSWTGVEFFYDFMINNEGVGPFMREIRRREVIPGDVIQLANDEEDFYHTLMVTAVEGQTIYVSAHSDDALDRRLSTYNYAFLRYLRVEGVRVEHTDDTCFEPLIEGEALPVPPPMPRETM
ncbi:MAG: amidase domain-containing protein [Clostridia bacterium]|nr:amidase domain-containing protein [Clostridia bacterium]